MMRKDLIIAVIATFCLTSTLFLIVPTRSQTSNPEYDPWTDLNDDGVINILDLVKVAIAFGATGTPINKTALLLNLQLSVDNLNESLIDLESRLGILENWTTRDPTMTRAYFSNSLEIGGETRYYEIISLSNVYVWEGANVFVIASGVTGTPYGTSLSYRHGANGTYGGSGQFINSDSGYLQAQHLWTNLTAGTYTFNFECYITPGYRVGVFDRRLTVIVT